MKAYGSENKRTRHDCRVYRAGGGRKILYTVGVKARKAARRCGKRDVVLELLKD